MHEAEVAAQAERAVEQANSIRVYEDDEDYPYAEMKRRKATRLAAEAKRAAEARRHNFLGVEMRLGLVEQATEACAALDYVVGEAGQLMGHAAFLHATVNTAFLTAALEGCVALPAVLTFGFVSPLYLISLPVASFSGIQDQ